LAALLTGFLFAATTVFFHACLGRTVSGGTAGIACVEIDAGGNKAGAIAVRRSFATSPASQPSVILPWHFRGGRVKGPSIKAWNFGSRNPWNHKFMAFHAFADGQVFLAATRTSRQRMKRPVNAPAL